MEQIEINEYNYQGRFWGEKNIGFDAMYKNMKDGTKTTSEFLEFVKEFTNIQDSYQKSITKLNNKISSYNSSSFKLCWEKLHKSLEIYTNVLGTFNEQRKLFIDEIQSYYNEQTKDQRSMNDKSIYEAKNAYQNASDQLQKTKENFKLRKNEYLKVKQSETVISRDVGKVEAKLKNAKNQLHYAIDKYNNHRSKYINKMNTACEKFQQIEENHLAKMLNFLKKFTQLSIENLTGLNDALKIYFEDIQKISTGYLIKLMLDERGTGKQEPQEESFDDQELVNLNMNFGRDQSKSFSISQISNDISPMSNVNPSTTTFSVKKGFESLFYSSSFKVNQDADANVGPQPRSSSAEKEIKGQQDTGSVNFLPLKTTIEGIMNIDQKFDGSHGNLAKVTDVSSTSQRSSPLIFNSTLNLSTSGLNSLTKKFSRNPGVASNASTPSAVGNLINGAISPTESLNNNYHSMAGLSLLASGEKITSVFRNRRSKGREKNQSESSSQSQQLPRPVIVQKSCNDWRTASITEDFQVDEDGYRINPQHNPHHNSIHDSSRAHRGHGSFSSSSSNDDDDDPTNTMSYNSSKIKKLNVVIKPLESASNWETTFEATNNNEDLFKVDFKSHETSDCHNNNPPVIDRPKRTLVRPDISSTSNLFALPPPEHVFEINNGLQKSTRSMMTSQHSLTSNNNPLNLDVSNSISRERPRPSSVLSKKLSIVKAESTFSSSNATVSCSSHTLNESFADFDKFPVEDKNVEQSLAITDQKPSYPHENNKLILNKDFTQGDHHENDDTLVEFENDFSDNNTVSNQQGNHDLETSQKVTPISEDQNDETTLDRTIDQEGESIFISAGKDKKDDSLDDFDEIDEISDNSRFEIISNDKSPKEEIKEEPESQKEPPADEELYGDPEMTEDDIIRRLVAFGEEKQKKITQSTIPDEIQPMQTGKAVVDEKNDSLSLPQLDISVLITEEWAGELVNGGATSFHHTLSIDCGQHKAMGKIIAAISKGQAHSWLELIKEDQLDLLPEPFFILTNAYKIVDIRTLHMGIHVERVGNSIVHVKVDRITFYAWLKRSLSLEMHQYFIHLELVHWSVDVVNLRPPILLCTYWRCEKDQTDFRLDYSTRLSFNGNEENHEPKVNQNQDDLEIAFQCTKGKIGRYNTTPPCKLSNENQLVQWNVPLRPVKCHDGNYNGTISGMFQIHDGPGHPETIHLKFTQEGCLPSGLKCSLTSADNENFSPLRLPLVRERLVVEKYICTPVHGVSSPPAT